MTNDKRKFSTYMAKQAKVRLPDGRVLKAIGIGTIEMELTETCGGGTISLSNTLHVPELCGNIISGVKVAEKRNEVRMSQFDIKIITKDD